MSTYKEIESVLQTYSLEDIIDYNDTSPEDVLYFLVEQEFLELPDVRPIDFED